MIFSLIIALVSPLIPIQTILAQPIQPDISGVCIVTSEADDGDGTLRQAIATPECEVIRFATDIETVTLTTGELTISRDLTIEGRGMGGATIRPAEGAIQSIFTVQSGTTVVLDGLTITGGRAFGGIYSAGNLTLRNSTVRDNTSGISGGGIKTESGSKTHIVNSTITGNEALATGGGIFANGDLTIVASSIHGNTISSYGGGLGGGIFADSLLVIENSTITGNGIVIEQPLGDTVSLGAGVFLGTGGEGRITNSTIVGNFAEGYLGVSGGVHTGAAELVLQGNILVGNIAKGTGAPQPDCAGNIVSEGHNLVGIQNIELSNHCAFDTGAGTDLIGITLDDLQIGDLADNGGPTPTMLPADTSPAIGYITDSTACPAIDQRGVYRPDGAGCDAGAVERATIDTLGDDAWVVTSIMDPAEAGLVTLR